ncbi:aminoacyl-tRNA editing enzymes ybaK [Vibrio sp. JCM 19236]|nr:aminoacyl-tRNA editing enzymes ybaK [Vibrio sp. JCM 19236]
MDIYQFLRDNQVSFQSFEHPPVLTIEEANQLDIEIPGLPTKNLFLRDGKGKKHWLWVGAEDEHVDLNTLSQTLEVKRLSLGSSNRLAKFLSSEPGRVSLLDIFRAEPQKVTLLITQKVWDSETLHCHPYANTATLEVNTEQLKPLLLSMDNEVKILN